MRTRSSSPSASAAGILLKAGNQVVDTLVLLVLMGVLAFGVWSIWDDNQIYREADTSRYEMYKPGKADSPLSFEDLVAMNPDVCGWLSIYDTGIDAPLVQGENNDEYLNKSVDGSFALSGSIFLDAANANDFSDFNTIIYGHHMEKSKMFGDLDKFNDETYFQNHEYGSLYDGSVMHKLQVIAMVNTDAYDSQLYRGPITDEAEQTEYISYIKEKAEFTRSMDEVKSGDHVLMLSTCATLTDGRYVLFARIL